MPTKRKTTKIRTTRSSKKTTRRAAPRKSTATRRRTTSTRSRTASSRQQSGQPGGGAGQREEAGGSGVYPASGPLPPENAPYHGMASWGQGERGAAGYEDSGTSEPSSLGGKKDLFGIDLPQDQVRPVEENESREAGPDQSRNQTESQRSEKQQGSQQSEKPREPRRSPKQSGSGQRSQ